MSGTSTEIHRADGRRVVAEMRTTASPEEVWRAWTDPAGITTWFCDEASGEAKPGGTLFWSFRGFGGMPYPVLVADAPHRLVLAGEIPGRGPFALEITILQSGGTTLVRLVNSGFLNGAEWEEEYEGVRSGWEAALALLKHALERHPGRARQALLLVRPAPVAADELYRHFTDRDALAAWLTEDGAMGASGDRASLRLRGGTSLTGEVIAATGREKSVVWEEEDAAVVELKGFGAPERMVGLRLTTWGAGEERLERLQAALSPAVERLAALFTG